MKFFKGGSIAFFRIFFSKGGVFLFFKKKNSKGGVLPAKKQKISKGGVLLFFNFFLIQREYSHVLRDFGEKTLCL
jgi:hypothetical protein